MGVVLGSIWIRTSTLKAAQGSSATSGQLEVITSFIFYPASWLTRVGLRYGTEANLQWSPGTGWNFNISAVKAVPESSLIFAMCQDGNVKGVQLMMSRGEASVKDTSPKGWTPLHFAAASGHADLCAVLIEAGAEKQALAYEGPTEDTSKKVEMMRVFGSECLDVSEINADGWIVGHNLIASMSQEQCPMSETSVHWIFNQKQSDILIALGATSIWHGIQQAVRAFLIEEHQNQVIHKLLATGEADQDLESESYVRAIGHWIALRASERDLLPMACLAAQILQVDGFDPFPGPGAGGLGRRDINRSLPSIYTAWAKTSSRVLSNAPELIEAEFDSILHKLSMNRESLARCIQEARDEAPVLASHPVQKCYVCHDNYTTLGTGLVQPRKISFDECRATQHKFHCQCVDYLQIHGVVQAPRLTVFGDTDEVDIEEEFCKEPDVNVDELCEEYDKLGLDGQALGDPFCEAATMLYRAQGRRWIGSHELLEAVCGACFLQQEGYIGAEGIAGIACFTPVPNTYISACQPHTLDSVYVN
ncbi:hypothetical protein DL98DRAFT_474589 [Cadophora sp. DSE1049]|nr:hypothetical protein DL98DRAFT_474589 [Cadophora sp. DSE1049]